MKQNKINAHLRLISKSTIICHGLVLHILSSFPSHITAIRLFFYIYIIALDKVLGTESLNSFLKSIILRRIINCLSFILTSSFSFFSYTYFENQSIVKFHRARDQCYSLILRYYRILSLYSKSYEFP